MHRTKLPAVAVQVIYSLAFEFILQSHPPIAE